MDGDDEYPESRCDIAKLLQGCLNSAECAERDLILNSPHYAKHKADGKRECCQKHAYEVYASMRLDEEMATVLFLGGGPP